MTIDSNYNIKINGHNTDIILSEIPAVSGASLHIFKKYGTEPNISSLIDFDLTASSLSDMKERLQSAKEHPVRNTIFTILRVMAIVAVVAIGVIGTMSSLAPVSIGVSSAALYFILSLYNAQRVDLEPKNWALLLLTLIGGPIFPIIEQFRKISHLENNISSLQKKIDTCFEERVKFFTNDQSALQKKIADDIEFLKVGTTEEAINGRNARIKALDELNRGITYFSQFKEITT